RDADIDGEPAREQPARRQRLPAALERRKEPGQALLLGFLRDHASLLTRNLTIRRRRRVASLCTPCPKGVRTSSHNAVRSPYRRYTARRTLLQIALLAQHHAEMEHVRLGTRSISTQSDASRSASRLARWCSPHTWDCGGARRRQR